MPTGIVRLLVPLAVLLMGALPSVPLELPEPIKFPQFLDTVRVSQAILAALTNKKWLIEADTGESVRARLNIRGHSLRIGVDYTTRGISFHYVDSLHLGYEEDEGDRYIHPNANKWLRQLGDEVQVQVQRLYFEREPAEVVPPVSPPPAEPAPQSPESAPPP